MKIIVTGGTGFIGGHTLPLLAQNNHQVAALHRCEYEPKAYDGVEWIKSEYANPDWNKIQLCLGGAPDVLIHLAAHGVSPDKADWVNCFKWNVMNSLDLFQAAILHGVKRIITCGSCFEYGAACDKHEYIPVTAAPEPLNAYSASKAAATMMLHGLASTHSIQGLVLRPCVVYGEGEAPYRLWPSLQRAAINGNDFPMTSGSQVRDFISVLKVAEALEKGVEREDLKTGSVLIENIGSGEPMSVKDFALEWWNTWGGSGNLLFGILPDREGEAARVVPQIS